MVSGVPCVDCGNWGRETRHCSLVTESFGKCRAINVNLAYRDVDLFPKGSVLELYSSNQPGKLMLETFAWDKQLSRLHVPSAVILEVRTLQ